jgi:high-affinity Fe2+/Pb2+ permease
MSQKNETLSLFLAVVIAIGLIFGGLWFLMERSAQLLIDNQLTLDISKSRTNRKSWICQN